jgi:hypothetical protein
VFQFASPQETINSDVTLDNFDFLLLLPSTWTLLHVHRIHCLSLDYSLFLHFDN